MSEQELAQRITNLENDMMLVRDGSIVEHISNAWHWKSTGKALTGGTDYTVDGTFTDLDLTSATSVNAKFAIIELHISTNGTATDVLRVRKNGDSPTYCPSIYCQVTGVAIETFAIVAMDSGQIIEYYATDASDTYILVLGYIE